MVGYCRVREHEGDAVTKTGFGCTMCHSIVHSRKIPETLRDPTWVSAIKNEFTSSV